MAQLNVIDVNGKTVGTLELKDAIFGHDVINDKKKIDLMFRYVDMQLAARRMGTASVKTRSEVSGGGRKPWAQKHTGRARSGSTRSPLWRHGGVIHGPKPKDWSKKLNKKMKKLALKYALSLRFQEGNLIILDDIKFETPRTREIKNVISKLGFEKGTKALFVLPWKREEYKNVKLSGRNIPEVKVIIADNPGNGGSTNIDGLNVYDILNHEKLVLTVDLVRKIEEVLG
ncbi:50S ribosomal protein L4 [Kosmotoga pacifica]|uniref:Large ribosomal subunit protein uL4 n=1 Tax=Kosmotoga pacifica TaxID=1330330 RepID=A0A0G2ZGG0_9BACT|nr:50S ribosomal protein L4 [Kosmotoga pacifica]AKI97888.1 50S ribosomal protein L4 [Kosmotoga pacifica]